MQVDYKSKYLKYKRKYQILKTQIGGNNVCDHPWCSSKTHPEYIKTPRIKDSERHHSFISGQCRYCQCYRTKESKENAEVNAAQSAETPEHKIEREKLAMGKIEKGEAIAKERKDERRESKAVKSKRTDDDKVLTFNDYKLKFKQDEKNEFKIKISKQNIPPLTPPQPPQPSQPLPQQSMLPTTLSSLQQYLVGSDWFSHSSEG